MNDLISVIIPVKNGGKYIEQAIKGIQKQGMDAEIIVVDDCSDDNTIEIAQNYGCKVVKHETSKGPVAGKNSGLKIANGKYILFHDHDDVMNDGALKMLYDEFEADIMAVEAMVQDFYSSELTLEEKAKTLIKKEPYYGIFTGAILIKKEVFDKIGYFNESVYAGEIIEWQTKMESNNFKIKKIDFVSTMRRVHDSNFGRINQKMEFRNYAAILRAKIKK